MDIPSDLRYTSDHEWARLEDEGIRVGITDFAQEALGDVVFVELPELGNDVDKGAKLGEVESTKSVSEIYSPVAGRIVSINNDLSLRPESVNSDPYGAGWFCVVKARSENALEGLFDAKEYQSFTNE